MHGSIVGQLQVSNKFGPVNVYLQNSVIFKGLDTLGRCFAAFAKGDNFSDYFVADKNLFWKGSTL